MDSRQSIEYLRRLFDALKEEIESINLTYLYGYCDTLDFDLLKWSKDSKACVVLSHAAFENFFESIAYVVSEHSFHEFKFNKRDSYSLPFLIWTKAKKEPVFDGGDWGVSTRSQLVDTLEEKKKGFHEFLTKNNHGIRIKHLNEVLRPVGIELGGCSRLLPSLEEFASSRGSYAHRFLSPGKDLVKVQCHGNPEKIRNLIADCLVLCGRVYLQAVSHVSRDDDLPVVMKELHRYCVDCIYSLKALKEGEEGSTEFS